MNIGIGSELTCEGRRFIVCEVLFQSETGIAYLISVSSRKMRFDAEVFFGDELVGTIVKDGPEYSDEEYINPRTWEPFTVIRVNSEITEHIKTTGETIVRASRFDLITLRRLWQVVHLEERGLEGSGMSPSFGRVSTMSLPVKLEGWPDCDGLEVDTFEVELSLRTADAPFRPGQCAMAEGFAIGYSLAKYTEDGRHYVVCVSPLTENDLAGPWKFKSETDTQISWKMDIEGKNDFDANIIVDDAMDDFVEETGLVDMQNLLRQRAEEKVA
ncbi:hypothetical protein [Parasedimentitalea maritima]|uniref:Uncharacterized protein n=1 Tax=Parasedimentitalea maritima TaxID=2578117 RepID=A0A6A4R9G4_9RHOB|nr:hypothetical protein [Zongyanglinia marina]KAE9625499.1 hypothetical protein GP644_22550 [Zongyanglinia marina]